MQGTASGRCLFQRNDAGTPRYFRYFSFLGLLGSLGAYPASFLMPTEKWNALQTMASLANFLNVHVVVRSRLARVYISSSQNTKALRILIRNNVVWN